MTYCFFRKISGREIAGVWKLAKLVTADRSTGDYQRWHEMSESDVNTSLYLNGLLVVLVLSGRVSLKLVCISIHGKISSVMNLLFGTWKVILQHVLTKSFIPLHISNLRYLSGLEREKWCGTVC